MTKTTVHLVVNINGCTIVVFYTDAHCWQFRVISPGGGVFGDRIADFSIGAIGFKGVITQISLIGERFRIRTKNPNGHGVPIPS